MSKPNITVKNNILLEGNIIDKKELVGIIETGQINQINNDYNEFFNKPSINEIVLQGNKDLNELGIQEEMQALTNSELEELLKY